MVAVSKRAPGQLVRCTKCGVEKPWRAGADAFNQERGEPGDEWRIPPYEHEPTQEPASASTDAQMCRRAAPGKRVQVNRGQGMLFCTQCPYKKETIWQPRRWTWGV